MESVPLFGIFAEPKCCSMSIADVVCDTQDGTDIEIIEASDFEYIVMK